MKSPTRPGQARPARHPTSLGWDIETRERSNSNYNPLPFAVRFAMAVENRPPKILSPEETRALLDRDLCRTEPLLSSNLARVRQEHNQSDRPEVVIKSGGRR